MMLGDAADLSTSTWRARNFKLSCDFEKNIPYSLPPMRDAMHDDDGAMMDGMMPWRRDDKTMSERMIADSIILQKRAAHDKTTKIHL